MIKAVILDWAGTTVDFGSMAPVAAFREAFGKDGLSLTDDLIRRFMGLPKKDHVRNMLNDEKLSAVFIEQHGVAPTETDVDRIYGNFEPALFEVLKEHAKPLPGVPETIVQLRETGIKIGSTTGYTTPMMNVLSPASEALGYKPDSLVCPDEACGIGRPYPYMLWENLKRLRIKNIREVIKIGDTAADIFEGKNAGCLSVGVIFGSNMLGLTEEEYAALDEAGKKRAADQAKKLYADAGADYVLERFTDIPYFIAGL